MLKSELDREPSFETKTTSRGINIFSLIPEFEAGWIFDVKIVLQQSNLIFTSFILVNIVIRLMWKKLYKEKIYDGKKQYV